ncbi:hypothetical protein GEMRC1_003882 [Eukaryota sp. GEM-RC1]
MTLPFANPSDVEDEEYQEESVIPSQDPLSNQETSVPSQMDDMYGSHDDSASEHWSEDEVPPPSLARLHSVSFDPEVFQKQNLGAALFEDDEDEDSGFLN